MVAPLDPDDPRALGEFRLTGRLGEGGQGVVYLGHTPGGEPVAVKVLKTGLDPAVRERLARELDAMRSVAPFCTARVLTAVVQGREPYVVSEFIDGPSLQQRVSSGGPLRGGELERLAVGTATALAAIHGAGIVHRDFKPGNVLLGPDGPRVVDFGIARQGESDTMTAGPIGTPAYLAPEQIAGHPASPASDVFAWGATIVFAATGRPAFGGDSVASVLHRIMTTEPDVSPVPAPLRATVERCLAKDAAQRPAARDLLLELVGSAPDPLRAGADAAVSTSPLERPPTGPTAGPANGHLTTQAGAERRNSRTGVIAGVAAAVAAVGITAVLLVPRFLPPSGTALATSSATSAAKPVDSTTPASAESIPPVQPSPAETDITETTETPGTTETAQPGGRTIPAAFAGTWRGRVTVTPEVMHSETDVEIVLESGKDKGTWKEPVNSCEGTLTLTGAEGSALTFRLEVPGCAPGTVTLTRKSDGRLAYRWDDDTALIAYVGNLTKA